MSNAYAVTNLLRGLAATAFTWSAGTNDSTRGRLNDAWMDARYLNGNAASGLTLVIDMGAAVALTGFALLNHNAAVQKTDATLKIESADDAAITVNAVVRKAASTLNSTAPMNKDHVVQFATGTARRYWRLTFTWTGTVTDFSIGEIFAFVSQTVLSRRSIYGDGEQPEIKTAGVEFYNGGTNEYFLGGPIRSKRLVYVDLDTTARDQLIAMWTATLGPVNPFLWIESYEATATAAAVAEQEVVYGKLRLNVFDWKQPDYLLFDVPDFTIKSLAREIGS